MNYMDDKTAFLKILDEDKFHFAWTNTKQTRIFSIEYIPGNYPSLDCSNRTVKTYFQDIKGIEWLSLHNVTYFDKNVSFYKELKQILQENQMDIKR